MMGAMSLIRLAQLTSHPLHSTANSRLIEPLAAASLPPHTLMQRAGLAVARLACAVAPHAQTIWLACGPGNNGGDGLEAAMHLQIWGRETGMKPIVTWLGDETHCPPDALASVHRARAAGVTFAIEPPAQYDLAIDALLGLGVTKPLSGTMATWLQHMHAHAAAVLCVDLPSGLDADTGCYAEAESASANATDNIANKSINTPARCQNERQNTPLFCLSLLTLKPGLFTAQGKDAAGQIWFDDLGVSELPDNSASTVPPSAWLLGADRASQPLRMHASHKGSFGDVAVIGGAASMTGAALLAARAALHAGAGRVFVALLDGGSMTVDPLQPELMFRSPDAINLRDTTLVCGCGGGDAVGHVLPKILSTAPRLVLDADALNAIAQDTQLQTQLTARAARGFATILTPHPLEAARLLACSTAQVQSHRLQAAQQLADRFACTVVLKGAGSVIAAPLQTPCINASGNAKLATAGTGDVLAGVVGAQLAASHAQCQTAFAAACSAVFRHGQAADRWGAEGTEAETLTASQLAQRMCA